MHYLQVNNMEISSLLYKRLGENTTDTVFELLLSPGEGETGRATMTAGGRCACKRDRHVISLPRLDTKKGEQKDISFDMKSTGKYRLWNADKQNSTYLSQSTVHRS